jgi:hypothetical protein
MLRITPNTPPAHSVDDVPTWINTTDPAWDHVRIDAEVAKLREAGAPLDSHPFHFYYSCATRYSLDAKMTIPLALRTEGGPETATMEDYFRAGEHPTRFELRSVGGRDWAIAGRLLQSQGAFEFARRGLVRVCDAEGPDGKPTTIDPPRDSDGGISEAWLDLVSAGDRQLLQRLGAAVFTLSQNRVAVAEGKA